jgi:tRNA 2-thiouridine synthesizing protein E
VALVFDGREIALDERGYLARADDWNEPLAAHMAALDGIALGAEHWVVIRFLRRYHAEFRMAPGMRLLLKALAAELGPEWATSRKLYRLFPEGPAKQACRYAGLPKPVSCI